MQVLTSCGASDYASDAESGAGTPIRSDFWLMLSASRRINLLTSEQFAVAG